MQDADTLPFDQPAPGALHLKVFADRKLCYTTSLDDSGAGPVELGRQRQGEPPPYTVLPSGGGRRLVIAPLGDRSVSRSHAVIQRQPDGRVRCANVSSSAEVQVEGFGSVRPGEEHTGEPPLLIRMGDRLVRVEGVEQDQRLASLGRPTLPPGQLVAEPERFRDVLVGSGLRAEHDKLIDWLRATMEVFQSAASAPDFLARAVKAVVSIVDLDVGAILEPDGGDWKVVKTEFASKQLDSEAWRPSRRMLDGVREQKSTFRYQPNLKPFEGEASQPDIVSMVAAPILDAAGELLGVLYGEQRCDDSFHDEEEDHGTERPPRTEGVGEVEAMLVELLASGVAAGLARLEQEQAAVAARVRFEQFFTPDLARQLQADARMLEGRDALVTVLFCDIRGFSRIAEQVGPEKTLAWIHDVMGELSECVVEEEGVLVDYQGDELMAMWGAPVGHDDQALRACRAAQRMLRRLPAINEQWEERLGRPTRIGIGVNTGVARVGNIGSSRKFKYGPLGNAVNLASRVQSATKQVGVELMLTGQTVDALPEGTPVRRLCQARVVNIHEPVTFYEMPADDTPEWREMSAKYEEALNLATEGHLRPAARALGNLVGAHPNEAASLKLLARVVDAMTDPELEFDPVWELRGK